MNKNEKKNLQDTTFLIPVRLDSIVRLENLIAVVNYIKDHIQSSIHVLEASAYNNGLIKTYLGDHIHYRFIEDFDPIFHRTKYINQLIRSCDTPYIAVWDADVVIPSPKIISSVMLLRNNKAQFVIPYQFNCLETSEIIREKFIQTGNLSFLIKNAGKMKKIYTPNPVGGAFFCHRKTYKKIGMENEHFYGWGREDGERVVRAKGFGYEFVHIEGSMFHLTHERGVNSKFHSSRQDDIKLSEVFRIFSMTLEELQEEVKHWHQNE
jgi:predicted glycosyltransferase involved in capsule biosynthesis